MKLKTLLLTLTLSLLLFGISTLTFANFNDGYDAYQKGDYETAVSEWKPLAEQGHAAAQNNLGVMYNKGRGVLKNDKQAVRWYRKAVEQGHAAAKYNLGTMYKNGEGVLKDSKQAINWWTKAANQGHAGAQYGLGMMYAEGNDVGKGVLKDNKQAANWYRKAADQGHAKAQLELNLLTNQRIEARNQKIAFIIIAILTLFILGWFATKEKRAKSKAVAAKFRAKMEAEAKIEAKAKAKVEAKAKAEAKTEAKAKAKVRFDAKMKELKAEKEAKAKAKLEAKRRKFKAEKEAKAEVKAEAKAREKLDSDLIKLHDSLPFYTKNLSSEFSSTNGDDSRRNDALNAIKRCDIADTTLYLVKVKSLNDDTEYYQIGVTTQSISSKFLKSPDSELVEVISSHLMEKRLALFAEFHFIREFRPKEQPDEEKKFSGYTEIVKKNSIRKIKSLFSTLPEYEAKASSFLSQALTDES